MYKYYINKITVAFKKGQHWTIGKLDISSDEKKVAYPREKEIRKKLVRKYGEIDEFKILEQEKVSTIKEWG
jgi:hypothetical protein